MKKINLVIAILCCFCLIGCSNYTDTGNKNYLENNVIVENSVGIEEEEDTIGYSVDEDKVVNTIGNSYSNLGFQCDFNGDSLEKLYTGRVTAQGDEIYFYEAGNIYSMDVYGNKKSICSSTNASSLNVIGDTLYYLENDTIYSVKIDGSSRMKLIEGVSVPFLICDGNIYYVTSINISATALEYQICKYSINDNVLLNVLSIGETMPTLVKFDSERNSIIFYYQDDNILSDGTLWEAQTAL